MHRLFRIFAVTETSMIICQGAWTNFGGMLPLGGSELAQLGVIFGGAFIINELVDCIRPVHRPRRRRRHADNTGSSTSVGGVSLKLVGSEIAPTGSSASARSQLTQKANPPA